MRQMECIWFTTFSNLTDPVQLIYMPFQQIQISLYHLNAHAHDLICELNQDNAGPYYNSAHLSSPILNIWQGPN